VRWWTWTFVAAVVGLILLSLWRGKPTTAGGELLNTIERQNGPRPTALLLLDYVPDAAGLSAARALNVDRGAGALPGWGMEPLAGQHWVRGKAVELVWRPMAALKKGEQELQQEIAGPAKTHLAQALGEMGYFQDGVQTVLSRAQAELDALSDEELFLAWVRADRAVMEESDDLARATREGLLLLARKNGGPVVMFSVGDMHVYMLPLEENAGVRVQLEGYEKGRMQWTGILRMDGRPSAQEVREMAVRVAQEVAQER